MRNLNSSLLNVAPIALFAQKTIQLLKTVTLLTLIAASFAARAQKTAYGNNAAAGKYYEVNGFKMYCEVYGTGKPILLIHGNNGSAAAFAQNIPYFSSKYKVVVADSRAQGKSIDASDSLSFEMMADDYAALLTILHIDSCYVLGWSDGGIIALLLAIRHPEKIRAIASTGANLWPDSSAVQPGLWREERAIFKRIRANPIIKNDQKNDRKLFLLDWFQPHISLKALHSIKCPALIISGDRDVINLEHTVLIYKNIPHAYLWVLPHSGHGTLTEHSAEFNKKTDEFFRSEFK